MSTDPLATAARDLFAANGYTGTHIKAIAGAAGVSLSAFYARFGSKEQAYRTVTGCDPPAAEPAGRALRTRTALLTAARACIERDGYHAARIGDIAEQADVSVGSFYTYFQSKLDIFTEVLRLAAEDLRDLQPGTPSSSEHLAEHARERIAESIQRYIDRYARFAILVQRLDEAIGTHPGLLPLRTDLHRQFADRITRSLRRWQAAGIADPHLDPVHTGDALAAMVGQAARVWINYAQPHDRDTAIATLTRLWTNGIRLGE